MAVQRNPVEQQILTRCQPTQRTVSMSGVHPTIMGELLHVALNEPSFTIPFDQSRIKPMILLHHFGEVRRFGQTRNGKRIKPASAVQRLLQLTTDALWQRFTCILIHSVSDGLSRIITDQSRHLITPRLCQAQTLHLATCTRHEIIRPALERPDWVLHLCHLVLGQALLGFGYNRFPLGRR